MTMDSDQGVASGMLHQALGYSEIEGYIEFDDAPCLIRIQFVKQLKDDGIVSQLGE